MKFDIISNKRVKPYCHFSFISPNKFVFQWNQRVKTFSACWVQMPFVSDSLCLGWTESQTYRITDGQEQGLMPIYGYFVAVH